MISKKKKKHDLYQGEMITILNVIGTTKLWIVLKDVLLAKSGLPPPSFIEESLPSQQIKRHVYGC